MCHHWSEAELSGFFRWNSAVPALAAILVVCGASEGAAQSAFKWSGELQGVGFTVESDNASSLNTVTVTPSGLATDNTPVSMEADGHVTGAEVADLDADGSPEIYVYVASAGSGAYGSVAAWAANDRKSLSEIHLPELAENATYGEGYMGHDRFSVAERYLSRSFPVYRDGDTNAAPSGGTRQVLYRLVPGEASWRLQIDQATDFEQLNAEGAR